MVAVPLDNVAPETIIAEVGELPEETPKKSFKEKLAEYEATLKEQTETIIRHVRYLCLEFWNDADCAESWAHEIIDMVELYIDLDFQRHAARYIMDNTEGLPLEAKKYIRKYFDLWT